MCVCRVLAGRSAGRMLLCVCACVSAHTRCRGPTAPISSVCTQMVALEVKEHFVGCLPPTGRRGRPFSHQETVMGSWSGACLLFKVICSRILGVQGAWLLDIQLSFNKCYSNSTTSRPLPRGARQCDTLGSSHSPPPSTPVHSTVSVFRPCLASCPRLEITAIKNLCLLNILPVSKRDSDSLPLHSFPVWLKFSSFRLPVF